ncbi:MAG: GNAT family N-acetyltransferase [Proteobacteria bacterium]|nr:GNAT family N-acetyltransferase [Pseudomonadota bacterium]
MNIRTSDTGDQVGVWHVLEPMLRAGDTYPLPCDMTREDALAYWFAQEHRVYVAEREGGIVGTYYLRANRHGGGAHVANCGYVTATAARRQGVARAMCEHSLDIARGLGFTAMQFNFVVSTNVRAVRLWQSLGFSIVGRLPDAFLHPGQGFVDAFVMYRRL